jgi:SAM-dependent methyltransferase
VRPFSPPTAEVCARRAQRHPFDAIVARLLPFHLPDRQEILRRQFDALRPGGTMVVVDFDIGAMRAEPEVPLVEAVRGWIEAAFRSAVRIRASARRPGNCCAAGALRTSRPSGIQSYFGPERSDRAAPVRGRHALAGAADRGARHRGRSGAGTRDAAAR